MLEAHNLQLVNVLRNFLRQRVVSDSIESNMANNVMVAESKELFLYFGTCSRCLLTMFVAWSRRGPSGCVGISKRKQVRRRISTSLHKLFLHK